MRVYKNESQSSLSSLSFWSSSIQRSSSISSRNHNKKWCFVFVFAQHGLIKIQVDASGDALLRYANGSKRRFIGWFDGPICERSKAIIPGLLRSINKLKSQNTRLKCYLLCSWVLFVFVLVYKK
uniref:Uncharacterized protein n=1 Tax=Lactuca sativa TaxID=4236 RepID=A0A9R1UJ46_LACSA|nr:hypothetical protein LSAT_V11C900500540 [Lactuca sativa]